MGVTGNDARARMVEKGRTVLERMRARPKNAVHSNSCPKMSSFPLDSRPSSSQTVLPSPFALKRIPASELPHKRRDIDQERRKINPILKVSADIVKILQFEDESATKANVNRTVISEDTNVLSLKEPNSTETSELENLRGKILNREEPINPTLSQRTELSYPSALNYSKSQVSIPVFDSNTFNIRREAGMRVDAIMGDAAGEDEKLLVIQSLRAMVDGLKLHISQENLHTQGLQQRLHVCMDENSKLRKELELAKDALQNAKCHHLDDLSANTVNANFQVQITQNDDRHPHCYNQSAIYQSYESENCQSQLDSDHNPSKRVTHSEEPSGRQDISDPVAGKGPNCFAWFNCTIREVARSRVLEICGELQRLRLDLNMLMLPSVSSEPGIPPDSLLETHSQEEIVEIQRSHPSYDEDLNLPTFVMNRKNFSLLRELEASVWKREFQDIISTLKTATKEVHFILQEQELQRMPCVPQMSIVKCENVCQPLHFSDRSAKAHFDVQNAMAILQVELKRSQQELASVSSSLVSGIEDQAATLRATVTANRLLRRELKALLVELSPMQDQLAIISKCLTCEHEPVTNVEREHFQASKNMPKSSPCIRTLLSEPKLPISSNIFSGNKPSNSATRRCSRELCRVRAELKESEDLKKQIRYAQSKIANEVQHLMRELALVKSKQPLITNETSPCQVSKLGQSRVRFEEPFLQMQKTISEISHRSINSASHDQSGDKDANKMNSAIINCLLASKEIAAFELQQSNIETVAEIARREDEMAEMCLDNMARARRYEKELAHSRCEVEQLEKELGRCCRMLEQVVYDQSTHCPDDDEMQRIGAPSYKRHVTHEHVSLRALRKQHKSEILALSAQLSSVEKQIDTAVESKLAVLKNDMDRLEKEKSSADKRFAALAEGYEVLLIKHHTLKESESRYVAMFESTWGMALLLIAEIESLQSLSRLIGSDLSRSSTGNRANGHDCQLSLIATSFEDLTFEPNAAAEVNEKFEPHFCRRSAKSLQIPSHINVDLGKII